MLTLIVGSFLLSVGCSKSNNNNSSSTTKDSVLYSAWQSLNMTFGNLDSKGDSIYYQNVTASAITQNVLDKGSVLVYVSNGGGSYATSTDAGFSVILSVGGFQISTIGAISSGWSYRYIIIPGNIATTSVSGVIQTYTPNQLKTLSYTTLTSILGISESKKLTQ